MRSRARARAFMMEGTGAPPLSAVADELVAVVDDASAWLLRHQLDIIRIASHAQVVASQKYMPELAYHRGAALLPGDIFSCADVASVDEH